MTRLSKFFVGVAVVALAHLSAGRADAVVINFNDGTDGAAVGAFYAGLGVTFSNAEFDGFVSPNEAAAGASGLKSLESGRTSSRRLGLRSSRCSLRR